jgi:predicted ATPase/transcriptional regulator with XRE-family HTH domain
MKTTIPNQQSEPQKGKTTLFPNELFQMYRRRLGITQKELAGLLGLNSSRMIRGWEAGDSLPKADRLCKLLEVCLRRGAFTQGQELTEAQQLWNCVKDFFDNNRVDRVTSYPVFDHKWFEALLERCQQNLFSGSKEVSAIAAFKPEKAAEPSANCNSTNVLSIPMPMTQLIGRDRELGELSELLQKSNTRLLTLTGIGGAGKTRLAVQVGLEISSKLDWLVYWVDLTKLREPNLLLATIIHTCGIKEKPTNDPHNLQYISEALLLTLKEAFYDKSVLLILDNFEQIVKAGVQLKHLLTAIPTLKVLVTSREALQLYGEQEYQLTSLQVPDLHLYQKVIPFAQLKNYAALRLFEERASAIKPDFKLTERNILSVANICSMLDGIPLALELAATPIRMYSIETLEEELKKPFSLLVQNMQDVNERHLSLYNTLEWSYNLLNNDEKRLFRWLGLFPAGCTVSAAEHLLHKNKQEILRLMDSLIKKSLIYAQEMRQLDQTNYNSLLFSELQFKMLKIVREYALEKLQSEDISELRKIEDNDRLTYYKKICEQAEPKLKSKERDLWVFRLELELDNLRDILEQASAATPKNTPLAITGLCILGTAWRYWYNNGYIAELSNWFSKFSLWQPQGYNNLPTNIFTAKALNGAGLLARIQKNTDLALVCQKQSLLIYQLLSDSEGIATSLLNIGGSLLYKQEYDQAKELFKQCLDRFSELGHQTGLATAFNNLGVIAQEQEDYEQAEIFYLKSLTLHEQLGNLEALAGAFNNLGRVAHKRNNYVLAKEYYEKSLSLNQSINNRPGMLYGFGNLAEISRLLEDSEGSNIYLQKEIKLRELLGVSKTPLVG